MLIIVVDGGAVHLLSSVQKGVVQAKFVKLRFGNQ